MRSMRASCAAKVSRLRAAVGAKKRKVNGISMTYVITTDSLCDHSPPGVRL